jgi:hypothetical protein
LQDPPKFTQIGIFGLKICHLATLRLACSGCSGRSAPAAENWRKKIPIKNDLGGQCDLKRGIKRSAFGKEVFDDFCKAFDLWNNLSRT